MIFIVWVTAGALAAAVVAALVSRGSREAGFWAAALVVAALVYPAVAIARGSSPAAMRELAGALPWVLAGLTARRLGLLPLAVAWALHGVLDTLPVRRVWMPEFYPPLCLGFDLVAALRVVWLRYTP